MARVAGSGGTNWAAVLLIIILLIILALVVLAFFFPEQANALLPGLGQVR